MDETSRRLVHHNLAMKQPCALEDHYPLIVRTEDNDANSVFGYVRTNSAWLDGCGGRTDVHDLFSLFWAAVLRANGVASSRLLDEAGFTDIPGEIYARWLSFDQVSSDLKADTQKALIGAHTGWASHALDGVFDWNAIGGEGAGFRWQEGEADELISALEAYGKFPDYRDFAGRRDLPDWYYAKSTIGKVSIAVLPANAALSFRTALMAYDPVAVSGQSKTSVLSGTLRNAVSNKALTLGIRILRAIEGKKALPWTGAASKPLDKAMVLLPLESHFLLLGRQTVVAVQSDCGLRSYESERTKFLDRRAAENSVFSTDVQFIWETKLDGGRFEDLVYDLLSREKGVVWVRQAGPTRERDGGRDFVARWRVSNSNGAPSHSSSAGQVPSPSTFKNVVVQVKAHRPSVGKSKVLDIRDSVEKHQGEGYFLVAFPQPANSLVEHLLMLGRSGVWTDWWDRAQIETRLRLNLDLMARYSDLVTTVKEERGT